MYVTDKYPEGAKGALDLSPNAFAKIGNMADGKIPISWKIIKAPISGNVAYRIKEGSSKWWAAIQVRNHKYPIMKMEYYKDDGSMGEHGSYWQTTTISLDLIWGLHLFLFESQTSAGS